MSNSQPTDQKTNYSEDADDGSLTFRLTGKNKPPEINRVARLLMNQRPTTERYELPQGTCIFDHQEPSGEFVKPDEAAVWKLM